jgi:hypothetical protein
MKNDTAVPRSGSTSTWICPYLRRIEMVTVSAQNQLLSGDRH